jgi:hypothetical protein
VSNYYLLTLARVFAASLAAVASATQAEPRFATMPEVTLYVPDRTAWLKHVGVGSTSEASAVVVSAGGQIRAVAPQSQIKSIADLNALVSKGL